MKRFVCSLGDSYSLNMIRYKLHCGLKDGESMSIDEVDEHGLVTKSYTFTKQEGRLYWKKHYDYKEALKKEAERLQLNLFKNESNKRPMESDNPSSHYNDCNGVQCNSGE